MGCSSSKTPVVEAPQKWGTSSRGDRMSSSAKGKHFTAGGDVEDSATTTKFPASEAFIIPLDNNIEIENINAATTSFPTPIKKPPKRLQKLIKEAASSEPSFKLEDLEEKLNKAELRRKEFLQQKIDNIPKTMQLLMRPIENKDPMESSSHTQLNYANEIKAKALDDDSKQELLTSTLKN